MWVMRIYHLVALAPALLHLAARGTYVRHREAVEAASRLACFGVVPLLWWPSMYHVATAVQVAAYSRPLVVLVWGHLALPLLQRLYLPLHVACVTARVVQDANVFEPMLLSGAYSRAVVAAMWVACVLAALVMVAWLEWRQRLAYLAWLARGAAKRDGRAAPVPVPVPAPPREEAAERPTAGRTHHAGSSDETHWKSSTGVGKLAKRTVHS